LDALHRPAVPLDVPPAPTAPSAPTSPPAPVPPVQATAPGHSVLPATPPIVNPTSSGPSVAPIGTSTDSSARTSAPPTPRPTVSGTSTVPTPPSPAPPTPSAPTRVRPAPVPLVPARSSVRTREKHAQPTRSLHAPRLARLPADLLTNMGIGFTTPSHLQRTSLPCICLTLLLLPASTRLPQPLILIH
jgi:hypothetical protein